MYLRVCTFTDRTEDDMVVVKGPTFVIGRAADCNLQLMHSTVSRHHCQLSEIGRFTTVRDMGSSNGTYLNGNLLRGVQVVRGGDKLSLGMVLLEVHDIPEVPHTEAESTELREVVQEPVELVGSGAYALSLV